MRLASPPLWQTLSLPVALSVAMIAGQSRPAPAAPKGKPDRGQVLCYNLGRDAWTKALASSQSITRDRYLRRAQIHFESAIDGVGVFPEAQLALASVHYAQNHPYRAEPIIDRLTRTTTGPLRAEALTYQGVLALRAKNWKMAREAFAAASAEGTGDGTVSARGDEKAKVLAEMRDRVARLDGVRRAGFAVATLNQAVVEDPAHPPMGDATYPQVIADVERMLNGQVSIDGRNAAIWRWENRANWSQNLLNGAPSGARAATPEELAKAASIYSGMMVSFDPPLTIPSADGLAAPDRNNLVVGMLRRLMKQELAHDYAGALALADRLATMPEAAITARQHRIWLRLEGGAGVGDLAAAKSLIYGAGMNEDPLLYDEIYSLGEKLEAAGDRAGALAEFHKVVAGIPGVPDRPNAAYLKPIAQWNSGALTLKAGDPAAAAVWQHALEAVSPQEYNSPLRMYLALRLAEAHARSNNAAGVKAALDRAQAIAAGQAGGKAVPDADLLLSRYRRYLSEVVSKAGKGGDHAELLRMSGYGAESAAYDAAQLYAQSKPTTGPAWTPILNRLREARAMAADGSHLAKRLDANIADITRYQTEYAAYSGGGVSAERAAFISAWNEATNATRAASAAGDWESASGKWRQLAGMAGGSDLEKAEAASLSVRTAAKRGDVLIQNRDREGARAAYQSALDGIGALPVKPDDTTLETGLRRNVAVLGRPAAPQPRRNGAIPAYTGGLIRPPSRAIRCTIVRFTKLHTASKADIMEVLRANPGAVKRLVDWFNNGPQAKSTPGAKRDFTSASLLDYLDENLSEQVGQLPVGKVQWCDHNGAGPWHSYRITREGAAYYLNDGTPILNAFCANPIGVIREGTVAPPERPRTFSALPRTLTPPAPGAAPGQPSAPVYPLVSETWMYPPFGLFSIAIAADTQRAVCVLPRFTVLVNPQVTPRISPPDGPLGPPKCFISREDLRWVREADYPRGYPEGTAENRKRLVLPR